MVANKRLKWQRLSGRLKHIANSSRLLRDGFTKQKKWEYIQKSVVRWSSENVVQLVYSHTRFLPLAVVFMLQKILRVCVYLWRFSKTSVRHRAYFLPKYPKSNGKIPIDFLTADFWASLPKNASSLQHSYYTYNHKISHTKVRFTRGCSCSWTACFSFSITREKTFGTGKCLTWFNISGETEILQSQ